MADDGFKRSQDSHAEFMAKLAKLQEMCRSNRSRLDGWNIDLKRELVESRRRLDAMGTTTPTPMKLNVGVDRWSEEFGRRLDAMGTPPNLDVNRRIEEERRRMDAMATPTPSDVEQQLEKCKRRLDAVDEKDPDQAIPGNTQDPAATPSSESDQPPTSTSPQDVELALRENTEIETIHDMFLAHRRILPTTSDANIQQRHILLAQAFAWGQAHADLHFRDAIVDEIISISKLPDLVTKTRWSPGAIPIRIIYDCTRPGDKARLLMVHLYACHAGRFWPSDEEDDFCKSFLFDLARQLLARGRPVEGVVYPGLGPESARLLSPCFWHEHIASGKRCWKVRVPEGAPGFG